VFKDKRSVKNGKKRTKKEHEHAKKIDWRGGDDGRFTVSGRVTMLYSREKSYIKQECRSVFAKGRRHIRLVCEHAISSSHKEEERGVFIIAS
jgi:hypothetical protein